MSLEEERQDLEMLRPEVWNIFFMAKPLKHKITRVNSHELNLHLKDHHFRSGHSCKETVERVDLESNKTRLNVCQR